MLAVQIQKFSAYHVQSLKVLTIICPAQSRFNSSSLTRKVNNLDNSLLPG